MKARDSLTLLRRFFTGLTEQTFQVSLGVVDPPLVDYVSELLVRFARSDQLHAVRGPNGRPVREIDRMVTEAEARIGPARRQVYRHIGDYALFWTGLFPESLRRQRLDSDVDWFDSYCRQGKRSYLIASSIDSDSEEDASSDVLARLGGQFELCAYGLTEIRRMWAQREEGNAGGGPLLIN